MTIARHGGLQTGAAAPVADKIIEPMKRKGITLAMHEARQ
jgi:hypothetical protein